MHIIVGLSGAALDAGAAIASVNDPACGGIASFIGTVRIDPSVEASSGKEVVGLDYEAHPDLAETRLHELCSEACSRWGLHKVVVLHRTGSCGVGEPTVVIACSAPHRAEALDACRWMIDTLKETVPIWKKENYADGSAWVGAGS